jgi:hypothetical protein
MNNFQLKDLATNITSSILGHNFTQFLNLSELTLKLSNAGLLNGQNPSLETGITPQAATFSAH